MPRIIVLGTGTGVGKTFVATALARSLEEQGAAVVGLKPIETGAAAGADDARRLEGAVRNRALPEPHPLYALDQPVSPHLAGRLSGQRIDLELIAKWLESIERHHTMQYAALHVVLETAGGVFSPLTDTTTVFDLARRLEPAVWLLVAADALGVLHDLRAALEAMTARGRCPDHVILCAARSADASTGTNAAELARVGLPTPAAVIRRDHAEDVEALTRVLLSGR